MTSSVPAELATPPAGRIVVGCVVPMALDKQGAYVLDVAEGSVAQQAAALLSDSHVAGAFHHLSAALPEDLSEPTLDGDASGPGPDRQPRLGQPQVQAARRRPHHARLRTDLVLLMLVLLIPRRLGTSRGSRAPPAATGSRATTAAPHNGGEQHRTEEETRWQTR
jgi:hypothetical protein